MKRSNLMTIFVAGFLVLTGLSGQAASLDGGNSGGGGDIRCAEYSDLVGKIAYILHQRDPKQLAMELNGVDGKVLWKVKQNLKCIPVKELNRQAFSYPKTATTKLLVSSWEEMSYEEKVRLAAHELCVLAEYERDGQYALSQTITQYLTLALEIYGPHNYGVRYPDGSTAFEAPRADSAMVRGNTIEEADSFCKFLGLGSALKFEVEPIKIMGTAIDTDYSRSSYYVGFATIENGELVSIERDRSKNPETVVDVFSSLVCGRAKQRPESKARLK